MIEYPRDLLISEEVIRDFEERIGVRFINKTECSKALAEHDAKVRAEVIEEFAENLVGEIEAYASAGHSLDVIHWARNYVEQLKEQKDGSKAD